MSDDDTETDDFIMSEQELDQALEGLDYMLQHMEPFKQLPDEEIQDRLQDFIDFMGFHPGTLHKCYIRYLWITGNLEDPVWLGENSSRTDLAQYFFETDINELFFIVDTVLITEKYSQRARKDVHSYYLKVLVRDKVAYTPIPIDQIDENGANFYKTLFRQIITS